MNRTGGIAHFDRFRGACLVNVLRVTGVHGLSARGAYIECTRTRWGKRRSEDQPTPSKASNEIVTNVIDGFFLFHFPFPALSV